MTIPELIERLELLDGPSPEIDARIWCYLNGKRYSDFYVSDRGEIQALFRDRPRTREQASRLGRDVQAYTASMDAAIALVERVLPGWGWTAGKTPDGMAMAGLRRPTPRGPAPERGCDRHDGNVAIALVLALLKAKQGESNAG